MTIAVQSHSQQPVVFPRFDIPILAPGMKVEKKIEVVREAISGLGRELRKQTIALIRTLITARHLFPADVPGSEPLPRIFDLHAPIQNLWIGRAGVACFLHEISPALAEQDSLIDSICNIVNFSFPPKINEKQLQSSILSKEDAAKAPQFWSPAAQLFVLKLGNWDEIQAPGIRLLNADLRGVTWKNANLRGADLGGADLSGSNLSETDLAGARLKNCIFHYAILRFAKFNPLNEDGTRPCNADGADFFCADLTGINATGARFVGACFHGATTTDALFTLAHLSYTTGLTITPDMLLAAPELLHAEFRSELNAPHLFDNMDVIVRSRLHTLSAITKQNDHLHNEALLSLIETTGAEIGWLPDIGPLANTLLTQTRCWPDNRLRKFTDTYVLPLLLAHWNDKQGLLHDLSLQQVMTYIIKTKAILDWPKYCGALSQMLIDAEVSHRIDERNALCAILRRNPAIDSIARAIEAENLGRLEECSIFIARDFKTAIVYTNNLILKMLGQAGSPYDGYCFSRSDDGSFIRNRSYDPDAVKACAVPLKLFNIAPSPEGAVALLNFLFVDKNHRDPFLRALTYRSLSSDEYAEARTIPPGNFHMRIEYNRLSDMAYVLTVPYCGIYWGKFSGTGISLEESDQNKGRMLLCMAALFAKYAAPEIFGADRSQAATLVHIATIFLNSALMFNPQLIEKDQTSPEGIHKVLMADLPAIVMKKKKDDPALASCFQAIYPNIWMPESISETIPETIVQPRPRKSASPIKPIPAARRVSWPQPPDAAPPDAGAAETAASRSPRNTRAHAPAPAGDPDSRRRGRLVQGLH